jgi:hypothetical protein
MTLPIHRPSPQGVDVDRVEVGTGDYSPALCPLPPITQVHVSAPMHPQV